MAIDVTTPLLWALTPLHALGFAVALSPREPAAKLGSSLFR